MTNCHILRKVVILQSHLIRGEKEKQQLFYFWYREKEQRQNTIYINNI